jgi:hypothetical protein
MVELGAKKTGRSTALAGGVSGGKLRFAVADAPSGSLLLAARYDGDRLTDVRILPAEGDMLGEIRLDGSGAEYRLMLVDGAAYAPLCAAWSRLG